MSDSPHFFSRSCEGFGGKISFVMTDLINELRRRDSKEKVGIFRLNGSNQQMNQISSIMDSQRFKDWDHITDINTIACLLKKHLRDSVEVDPLFPSFFLEKLQNLVDNNDEFISGFNETMKQVSRPRFYSIVFLFKYLIEINDNSDVNKMNAENIAICMSPNLFETSVPDANDQQALLKSNTNQNKITSKLIELGHQIFDEIEIPEDKFINDEDIPMLLTPILDTKNAQTFLKWRNLRRKSLIPYIPPELSTNPAFSRPIEPVKV